jgi:hypothetical protein
VQGTGKVYYAYNSYSIDSIYDSNTQQAGNRRWEIYGNESYFYLFNANNISYSTQLQVTGCGQYDSLHQGYNYNTFLSNGVYDSKTAATWHNISIDANQLIGFQDERIIRSLSNLNSFANPTIRVRSLNGIAISGYNSVLNVNGPLNLLKMYVIDADAVMMGAFKNLFWLGSVRPLNNGQIFTQGEGVYKAINVYRANTSYEGQIVVRLA